MRQAFLNPSKHSLALVGYRAAGKTTVGKMVAEALGWIFLDMDDLLVQRFGMTIDKWVKNHGWESFRIRESELLRELSCKNRIVLATGGGVVEEDENRDVLKRNFFVVWLSCSVKETIARLASDERSRSNRPSLTGQGLLKEVGQVIERRKALYREVSDVVIEVDKMSPEEIKERICFSIPSALLCNKKSSG